MIRFSLLFGKALRGYYSISNEKGRPESRPSQSPYHEGATEMADEEYTSFDDLYGPVGADIPIQHSHASTGLWLDPNFPKRGWTINDHFDRGHDGLEPCQVCEVTPVRYALVMEHPDWPEILEAGCVCAGYMIGDKQTAEVSYRKAVAEAKKQPGYQKRAYNRRPSVETF